jgi:alpha-mannosidase
MRCRQVNGVDFQLAAGGADKPDAVVAKGQSIDLPEGDYNKVYVLAASADGDQEATFEVGKHATKVDVEDWGGFIGQWDTRLWKPRPDSITEGGGRSREPEHQVPLRKSWAVSANHATWDLTSTGTPDWSPDYPKDYLGLKPGFIKPATLAWYASHHHTPEGLNEPYAYSYIFVYAMDLTGHDKKLTLPSNDKIRVLAVSVAKEEPAVMPAQPLYDKLNTDASAAPEMAAAH